MFPSVMYVTQLKVMYVMQLKALGAPKTLSVIYVWAHIECFYLVVLPSSEQSTKSVQRGIFSPLFTSYSSILLST